MAKERMGEMISRLRKEQGMTQKDLAEKMSVTDKAVSKWERDVGIPPCGEAVSRHPLRRGRL